MIKYSNRPAVISGHIITYKFNEDCPEYRQLRKEIKKIGYSSKHINTLPFQYRHPADGEIHIDTKFYFSDQFNTSQDSPKNPNTRLHLWEQTVSESYGTIIGYYLGPNPLFMELIANTTTCGFCGQYYDADNSPAFCGKCLGSVYLKREDLHLLIPCRLSGGIKPNPEPDLKSVESAWVEAQESARLARIEKAKIQARKDLDAQIASSYRQYELKTYFFSKGLEWDNIIDYGEKGVCIGWRTPIPLADRERIQELISDASFTWYFGESK